MMQQPCQTQRHLPAALLLMLERAFASNIPGRRACVYPTGDIVLESCSGRVYGGFSSLIRRRRGQYPCRHAVQASEATSDPGARSNATPPPLDLSTNGTSSQSLTWATMRNVQALLFLNNSTGQGASLHVGSQSTLAAQQSLASLSPSPASAAANCRIAPAAASPPVAAATATSRPAAAATTWARPPTFPRTDGPDVRLCCSFYKRPSGYSAAAAAMSLTCLGCRLYGKSSEPLRAPRTPCWTSDGAAQAVPPAAELPVLTAAATAGTSIGASASGGGAGTAPGGGCGGGCRVPSQPTAVRRMATQRHVLRSGASVQNLCVQEILGRAKMSTVFEVIVIRSDGRTLEPNGGVTATELGLHSRDLSLFATDSRLSPQRATITARGDRILFRTEAIKAVIERDRCTLIKNKRDRDFHDIIKPLTLVIEAQPHVPFELSVLEVLLHVTLLYFERRRAHIHWMVDRVLGEAAGAGAGGGEGTLGSGDPFGGIGESTIQQFGPLGKMLTAVINDAKETCDAINRFLDDDREALGSLLLSLNALSSPAAALHLPSPNLAALGASDYATLAHYSVDQRAVPPPPPPLASATATAAAADTPAGDAGTEADGMGAAARKVYGVLTQPIGVDPVKRRELLRNQALEDASRILETYLREMESIVGSLLESEDFLESTRETYRMQLDSARNHIILVNLWISVASISLMVAALPSAFFGMNVKHWLEEAHGAFPLIVATSLGLAVGSFPVFMKFFTDRFMRQSRQDTRNLMMLRTFLMQHSDDLDSITAALKSLPSATPGSGPIRRDTFKSHLRGRLPRNVQLSDSHLDYLFDQFDRDNDGVISEVESTLQSKESYPVSDSGSNNGGNGGNSKGRGHSFSTSRELSGKPW